MIVSIRCSDIPADKAINFSQGTLRIIAAKTFSSSTTTTTCDTRRNYLYVIKKLSGTTHKIIEIPQTASSKKVGYFVARFSGASSSLLQSAKRFCKCIKVAVINIEQQTENFAGPVPVIRERCAQVNHVKQLLPASRVKLVEQVDFTKCLAAKQLAEFPVMGRKVLSIDARPISADNFVWT